MSKNIFNHYLKIEASRGAGAQSVTVKQTRCGFDPHSRRWNIYLNLYFHFFALVSRSSAALSSATQHAMPPEFGRKLGTECLNTRFPLPNLLCAGYSVKLNIYIWIYKFLFVFLCSGVEVNGGVEFRHSRRNVITHFKWNRGTGLSVTTDYCNVFKMSDFQKYIISNIAINPVKNSWQKPNPFLGVILDEIWVPSCVLRIKFKH